MKRNTTISIVLLIILLGGIGYWLVMHTNRGSSLALYAFAGIRAPLGVKFSCARSTDIRVAEKFRQPLDFTKDAKDALRGFWYYDYYRECLYSHGYDFSGRSIQSTSFEQGVYRNRFSGFEFVVPASVSLIADNVLDVDYDNHLYSSRFKFIDNVTVHAYLEDSTQTFGDSIERISVLPEPILSQTSVVNRHGIQIVKFTGASGTRGIAFTTPNDWAVYVYGSAEVESVISSISDSLMLIP